MTEQSPLSEILHAERTAKGSLNADCWACEAAQSDAIKDLAGRLALAEARASHLEAVFARAVPDGGQRKSIWRDHWRAQLAENLASRGLAEDAAACGHPGDFNCSQYGCPPGHPTKAPPQLLPE